ncbi:MAG TPA: FAD binding domain-containing protein [Acidimicrobiales bacterium]|nr:FAD binding domain-containing protein [Acidimicrobiales bacterium]
MLRLPPCSYLRPGSVEEAAELASRHGERAMLVAGGTDLVPKMKRGQMEPEVLIGLGHLAELRAVTETEEGGFLVGAGVTLAEVSSSRRLAAAYPAFARAAALVSSPALRNVGTIGGNLCVDTRCNYYDMSFEWRQACGFCMKKDGDICRVAPASKRCRAIASSDTAPAAIALGARVVLVGPAGARREVPVDDLYRDDGQYYLAKAADEVVESVRLPAPGDWCSSYVKVRRRGTIDFPLAGVAVALRRSGPLVEDCRIVLTAVGSRPFDVSAAAAPLLGHELTAGVLAGADGVLAEVAAEAAKVAKPLDNADLHYVWRKQMTRRAVEQAIVEAAGCTPLATGRG